MKIKIVLFSVFASVLALLISSYREGPAFWAGYDCTGATGSRIGCSGGGCHGSTASNAVTIELDSAGTAVKSYYPGKIYTVKLSATNGTGANLPNFGFQMAAVKLAGAGTNTCVQGGTWDSTALPASVQYTPAGPLTCTTCSGWPIPIIEHSMAIAATTGSGGNGTTYVESVTWTAPDSGTGTVLLYGVLNAVNGDGQQSGDYAQVALADTITETVPGSTHTNTGIGTLTDKLNGFNVYPALANDFITLFIDLKQASAIEVSLISIHGQTVKTLMPEQQLPQGAFKQLYNVGGLAAGLYLVRVRTGNENAVLKIVKE